MSVVVCCCGSEDVRFFAAANTISGSYGAPSALKLAPSEMPVGEQWAMTCSLNLASCRLRAEALARQLHTKLWTPRAFESPDGSRSPCFGLPASAGAVVDTPPPRFAVNGECYKMSSLDDDDEAPDNAGDIVVTPPVHMSPPYSPVDSAGPVALPGSELYDKCGDLWRPESPPESLSEPQSDSPPGTIETEEPSTATNSTETVSELASPTFDLNDSDKGSALADELFSRLRQFQSLQVNGRSVASPQDDLTDTEVPSSSETLSDASPRPDKEFLSLDSCPRLVRSTSLKSGKTPPGTPSRKKIVRFADVLGLDLEAVRHFAQDDETPIVPQSAFADLHVTPTPPLPWESGGRAAPTATHCSLVPQFQQPVADLQFLDRVRQQKISLENVIVTDLRMTAVVRVLNLGFEKRVQARYTTTEWATHEDLVADYVTNSCDGFSDKFSFTLNLPHVTPGQRLVFALCYTANGQEFWDNNFGDNYVLRCQVNAAVTEGSGTGPKWMHHFM